MSAKSTTTTASPTAAKVKDATKPIVATAVSPTAATAKDAANPRLDEPKETAWSQISLAEALVKSKAIIKITNNEQENDFLNDSYALEE